MQVSTFLVSNKVPRCVWISVSVPSAPSAAGSALARQRHLHHGPGEEPGLGSGLAHPQLHQRHFGYHLFSTPGKHTHSHIFRQKSACLFASASVRVLLILKASWRFQRGLWKNVTFLSQVLCKTEPDVVTLVSKISLWFSPLTWRKLDCWATNSDEHFLKWLIKTRF